MIQEVSAVEVYKKAWEVFKKAPGQLILVTVVMFLINLIPSGVSEIVKDDPIISIIVSLIGIVVSGVLSLGLIDIVFRLIRTGEVKVSNLFERTDLIVPYLIAYIVYIGAFFLGLVFLIIPGIIILFKFSLFPYILVSTRDISPIEALKKSWVLLKGHAIDLMVFTLLTLGVALVTVIFTCGIGLLIAGPVIAIAYGIFYIELVKDFKNREDEENLLESN